jgi:hypothetical protein
MPTAEYTFSEGTRCEHDDLKMPHTLRVTSPSNARQTAFKLLDRFDARHRGAGNASTTTNI